MKSQAGAAKSTVRQPGVLVVDDEYQVRIMIQVCLERIGFEVWLARDRLEAIALFRQHREAIDVVLLDVRMPRLDGLRTLQILRKLKPDVQACFMCGDTGACTPEELGQRSGAYCIAKPFRLDALATILRLVTRGVSTEPLSSAGDDKDRPSENSHCGEDEPNDLCIDR